MEKLDLGTRKPVWIRDQPYISLPRIWARNMGITRESKLRLELDSQGRLVISIDLPK